MEINRNKITNNKKNNKENKDKFKNYTVVKYDKNCSKIIYSTNNKKYNKEINKENKEVDIAIYNNIVCRMIGRWQKHRDEINYLLNTGSPYYNEENLWDIYNNPYIDEELYEESDEEFDDIEYENYIDNDFY